MNHKHYISAGLSVALCLTGGCNTKAITTGTIGSNDKSGPEVSTSLEKKDHKGQLNSMESQGIALIRKGELDRAYEVYEKIAGLSYYRGRGEQMTPLSFMLQDIHDYGDMSRCVSWCRNFVEENPSFVNRPVAHNMAVIYAKTNNFEEAVAIMEPFLDDPDIGADFLHDYGMYCLSFLENVQMDESKREKLLSRTRHSIDEIGRKWGKNQRYHIALGEYYTVRRDFEKARETYEKSTRLQKDSKDYDDYSDSLIHLARARLMSFELGVATGNIEECKVHLEKIIEAYESTDPLTYDRFSPARIYALLFKEYFTGQEPVRSWQVEKLMNEYKKMEEKGMFQPRLSRKTYQELFHFLAHREKGDHQKALYHLDHVIKYAKVNQDCPTYHAVDIPVAVSMLEGIRGQLYALDGQKENAIKANKKALEYLPVNQVARREVEKLAGL